VNRKILCLSIVFLAAAMLTTSGLAIGPQKAEKNPNATFVPWGVQLRLSSGVFNEWVSDGPVAIHIQLRSPSNFHLGHFNEPANPSEIVENKWNFLSETVFFDYLVGVGLPAEDAAFIAYVVWAGGVYYKAEHVGN
jgi:hypothetical protein